MPHRQLFFFRVEQWQKTYLQQCCVCESMGARINHLVVVLVAKCDKGEMASYDYSWIPAPSVLTTVTSTLRTEQTMGWQKYPITDKSKWVAMTTSKLCYVQPSFSFLLQIYYRSSRLPCHIRDTEACSVTHLSKAQIGICFIIQLIARSAVFNNTVILFVSRIERSLSLPYPPFIP